MVADNVNGGNMKGGKENGEVENQKSEELRRGNSGWLAWRQGLVCSNNEKRAGWAGWAGWPRLLKVCRYDFTVISQCCIMSTVDGTAP